MPDLTPAQRKQLDADIKRWQTELQADRKRGTWDQQRFAKVHRAIQGARAKLAAKLTPNTGAGVAVHNALSFVGIVEHPAGSNKGPHISDWEKGTIGYDGVPWCGCFVHAMVNSAGGHLTSRCAYTPYIAEDARNHSNGLLKIVPKQEAKVGDIALFDFGTGHIEHTGLIRKDSHGGPLETVEGNTSFADGSQSNGGCVALKTRDLSVVAAVARPVYP